jgi:hypothetical protein
LNSTCQPSSSTAGGWLIEVFRFAFELAFALRELLTEGVQVHLGIPRLGEHATGLLFLLDVMLDHLGKHRDLRVEVVVVGR